MDAKIIDPNSGVTIRLVRDAEDLSACLLKIQEDSGGPLVLQIGGGGKMLHVIPC